MLNQGLVAGWTAWYALWEAKRASTRRLLEVGNRLKAPELSNAFGFWARDAGDTKRAMQLARLEREGRSMEAQLRRARFEAGQLDLMRLAHEDELAALRSRVDGLLDEGREREAALAASLSAGKGMDDLKAALEAAKLATDTAERLRHEAEEDVARQRRANQELLEKLLAAQRSSFEEERRLLREQHGRGSDHYRGLEAQMQDELAEVRAEVQSLHEELTSAKEENVRKERETAEVNEKAGRIEAELGIAREDGTALKEELFEAREEALQLERELQQLRIAKQAERPKAQARPSAADKKKKTSVLGSINLDESEGAPPVSEQIARALKSNAGRVLDLFREWDTDGDGEVSRKEFHKAMPALGLEVPKEEVDALFSQWDADGGGSISYKELSKILRQGGGGSAAGGSEASAAVVKGAKAVAAVSKLKAVTKAVKK